MSALSDLTDQLTVVHDESGGVLIVEILRPIYALGLLASAMSGDAESGRLKRIFFELAERIESAPRKKPMLCATCPRPVGRSRAYSIAVGTPGIDRPQHAIGLAICPRCATEPADLLAKAAAGFRKIWPDLRPINIHPTGSRA